MAGMTGRRVDGGEERTASPERQGENAINRLQAQVISTLPSCFAKLQPLKGGGEFLWSSGSGAD